ncbi:glycosyltransferase family 4 protein [Acidisphaera rubrifaciens]|uniref:glycosyltransferase family 4 protein n=1 Tax=Acidisphaera rubrifaciens TaxID=50715 RepID=UPI001F528845|nr:glycosyltransferase family 4 protein [Acidisphaera rubrifaciens]
MDPAARSGTRAHDIDDCPGAPAVVLITSNFPPVRGGSSVVYESLAKHASGRILVVAPRRDYRNLRPLAWSAHDAAAPYRVVRLAMLRSPMNDGRPDRRTRLRLAGIEAWRRARLLATLAGVLLRGGIRTVCVGELVAGAWILRVLRPIAAVRTVIYVHGEEITTRDAYDADGRRRRAALQAADAIIAVSPFTVRAIHDFLGPAADRPVILIRNGVDTARFRPGPRRADLVTRYGLTGCFVFVSVCRLLEKKGIDHAIGAFARLAVADPGCRLLIVGTGPDAARLRTIAEDCGVVDRVIFAGDVPDADLADHYRLGDVFVMPNRALPDGDTEGFGLVFLEANACGLPVIAGRDGGSADAVTDGENGLVVDGRSVDAIAAAMYRLRQDTELRAALAQRGREVATAADWRHRVSSFLHACGVPG